MKTRALALLLAPSLLTLVLPAAQAHDGPEQEVTHQGPTEVGFST